MSRIGKLPVNLPAGVTVTVSDDNVVTVKGPHGTLSQKVNENIKVTVDGSVLTVTRPNDEKENRSMRKPEPYKGKGIKFVGEQLRRKAGKSASAK